MPGVRRDVPFTREEMVRLREACRGLGTTYQEFVHFAVLRALDEVEGYARQERERQLAWERLRTRNR